MAVNEKKQEQEETKITISSHKTIASRVDKAPDRHYLCIVSQTDRLADKLLRQGDRLQRRQRYVTRKEATGEIYNH